MKASWSLFLTKSRYAEKKNQNDTPIGFHSILGKFIFYEDFGKLCQIQAAAYAYISLAVTAQV